MPRYGKWETVKELGSGGQGTVYLAYNINEFNPDELFSAIKTAVLNLAAGTSQEVAIANARKLGDTLEMYINRFNPSRVGAIKLLHLVGRSANLAQARERMRNEIEALRQVAHPNLIRLLDANLDENWAVYEYYDRGPISKDPALFRGDFVAALRAFRPLVEAVAELHKRGIVHRDIKPQNVFVASDGRLILGDMGLVFFEDPERTRITETLESVGSTHWMPPWAMGMRLGDVKPNFDVFSLGKLLWSMVSGKPVLRLWYWSEPEFDLETQFADDPNMIWAKHIFRKCIVERPEDCVATAQTLLTMVNKFLRAVSRNAQVVGRRGLCIVCGLGQYHQQPATRTGITNFGLNPVGGHSFYIFECSHCGHVQLFSLPSGMEDPPPAWKN